MKILFLALLLVSYQRYGLVSCDDDDDINPWGDDGDDKKDPQPVNGNQVSADELSKNENDQMDLIISKTTQMARNRALLDQIVVAAYKVSDYTPAINTKEQEEFWKKQIIPMLKQSLLQDVQGRRLMEESFSIITELAITLQKGGIMVNQGKGSKNVISVVKKNFHDIMQRYNETYDKVVKFSNAALNTFAQQTEQVLNTLGPEAANFTKTRGEVEDSLAVEMKKREEYLNEIASLQGQLANSLALKDAIQSKLKLTDQQLQEERKMISDLEALNKETQKQLDNVPDKVTVVETVSHNCFWFFHWDSHRTREYVNPNRDVDRQHYKDIIQARTTKIKEETEKAERDEKVQEALNNDYNKVIAQINATGVELKAKTDSLQEKVKATDANIDASLAQLKQINEDEKQMNQKWGLEKSTLVDCVSNVKKFGQIIRGGANAYDPLLTIYKTIRAEVQEDMDLLDVGTASDVYLAANDLLHQVKLLNKIAATQQTFFQPSDDYKKITNSYVFQAYALEYEAKKSLVK